MRPYIFTERNGIHIIDLQKTIAQLKIVYNAIKELAKNNKIILFVGTKRQAQASVIEEATRCGMPYVANRWLGGMITNFLTIQKSIARLNRLERMEVDGSFDLMTKKEVIGLRREKEKLLKNIGGIKELERLPDMVFIIDPKKEAIAIAEAMKTKIPIVAIVDTNCNPVGIDYPIPGNDDAIRAINLFTSVISSAVIEGQNEAGKIEITEETKIMSLAEEEKARAEREARGEEEESYISGEETPVPAGEPELSEKAAGIKDFQSGPVQELEEAHGSEEETVIAGSEEGQAEDSKAGNEAEDAPEESREKKAN